jgi:hypothetical protein
MATTYVHSVFCEDIRPEVAGKYSLMGVLGNEIVVPQTPVILPKVGIAIWIVTPPNKIYRIVRIIILFEENLLIDNVYPVDMPGDAPKNKRNARLVSQFQLAISPFHIPSEGVLKVRVHLDDGPEIKGGGLTVISSPEKFADLTRQFGMPQSVPST